MMPGGPTDRAIAADAIANGECRDCTAWRELPKPQALNEDGRCAECAIDFGVAECNDAGLSRRKDRPNNSPGAKAAR